MQSDLVRQILLAEGTSDSVLRRDIIRKVIYKASNLLAVGTRILPIEPYDSLNIKYEFPSELIAEYPVAEGEVAGREDVTWTPFTYRLLKGQGRFGYTYESKISGQWEQQRKRSMQRCVEAIAKKQDAEMIDKLIAGVHTGAGYFVNIAAGKEWDTASGDPVTDIMKAREYIMHYSNITNAEIRNLALLVSTNVSSVLGKLQLIGNVQQSLSKYLLAAYGIEVLETRDADLADIALLVVKGLKTGEHGIYTGKAVPTVIEKHIEGAGWDWLVTKWFASKIVPESGTDTDNYRIVRISNTKS